MLSFCIKRLLHAIPILLGVSVLVFGLVQLIPGNPIDLLLPPEASPELIEQMKAAYGFDRPLHVQYFSWLWRTLQGDLGYSIFNGAPVGEQLFSALGNTFVLAIPAALLGFALGILLGTVAAFHQGGWIDKLCSALAITGVSLPHYWFAIVMVVIFSVTLNWLPAQGMGFEGVPDQLGGPRRHGPAGDHAGADPHGRGGAGGARDGAGGAEPGVRGHAPGQGTDRPARSCSTSSRTRRRRRWR